MSIRQWLWFIVICVSASGATVLDELPDGKSPLQLEANDATNLSKQYSTVNPSSVTVQRQNDGSIRITSIDENGNVIDTDLNASKPSEMLQHAKELHPRSNMNMVTEIANKNNLEEVVSQDPSSVTQSALQRELAEDDPARFVVTHQNTGVVLAESISAIQAQFNNYLRCYISRKLVPAIGCSLASKPALFGGDITSDVEENTRRCAAYCKEPLSCIGVQQVASNTLEIGLSGGVRNRDFSVNINSKVRAKYVQMQFSLPVPDVDAVDVQPYENLKLSFRFDLYATRIDDTEVQLLDRILVSMDEPIKLFRAQIGGNYKSIRFHFYDVFDADSSSIDSGSDEEESVAVESLDVVSVPTISISNAQLHYDDVSYYYCDALQVMKPGETCEGEIVKITLDNGVEQDICKHNDAAKRGPEPTTGAFYTERSCQASCYMSGECNPAYTIPGSAIALSTYQVEIGCLDTPDNTRCTPLKCQQYFTDSTQKIFQEYNYVNETEKVATVQNLKATNAIRPNIDLAGEISGTGPDSAVFINAMKDQAYIEMVTHSRYVRSKRKIGESTEIQMDFTFDLLGENIRRLTWNIKPSNIAFNGAAQYKYVVLKLTHSIRPKDSTYNLSGSTIKTTGLELFNDVTYAVMTGLGTFEVFRRDFERQFQKIHNKVVIVEGKEMTQQVPEWIDLAGYTTDYRLFNKTSNTWESYSRDMAAPSFDSAPFSRGIPIKSFVISNDLYADLEAVAGGYVHYQSQPNGQYRRTYTGAYRDQERSYLYKIEMYGIYSDTTLSYRELESALTPSNIFFDNVNQGIYRNGIRGDAILNDSIKLYLQGDTNDMNVISEIIPNENEYGKKTFLFTVVQ